ncbi:MAG: choice-of-anchor U domain-containing protein [Halieaceae bacterium]|jgi:hypothetical protein|nr:choice-of-anchor U domain-containing protein [Halieaceae bacterium]
MELKAICRTVLWVLLASTSSELWAAVVSYDRNSAGASATSGDVPASQTTVNDEVVVAAPDALRKTVGGTLFGFTYWNTASDGSGVNYEPGDTLTTVNDVTLYAVYRGNLWAQWSGSINHDRGTANAFPPATNTGYRYAYLTSDNPAGDLVINEFGTTVGFSFTGESLGFNTTALGPTCVNGQRVVNGGTLSCSSLFTDAGQAPDSSYVDGTFVTGLDRNTGTSDGIATSGYGTEDDTSSPSPAAYAIRFDAPVKDVVLSIWSLGNPSVEGQWKFDQPWAFVNQETNCPVNSPTNCTRKLPGSENTLSGFEGDASIIFYGETTEITWEITAKEVYAAFTFGTSAVSFGESNKVVTVRSGNASSTQGDAIAAIAHTTEGLEGGDTLGGVTCRAYTDRSYSTELTPATPPGTYVTRCFGGTINDVAPATSYVVGYVNGTYTVNAPPPPADGVCGADNGQTLASTPTNLCAVGTSSGVSGTGDWTWTCQGVNGGASANCSAAILTNTVGGNASGIANGQSVVLQNNGGDDLTVSSNGAFTFATAINSGADYSVTVLTQPANQTCLVTGGSGTNPGVDVTSVTVSCVTDTYSIGGTLSGLAAGESVVLQNNAGDDLTVSASGAFTFATEIASGTDYAVTVLTQPTGQTCAVTNGSGSNVTADVTNVGLACIDLPDSDDDGTPDDEDTFPSDPVEDADTDGDGIGDNGDAGGTGVGIRIIGAPVACSFDGSVTAAPVTASNAPGTPLDTQLEFALTLCGASVTVQAVFGEAFPAGAVAYKVSDAGEWTEIPNASIAGDTVTYTIVDNGPLDADPTAGRILDPVTVVTPAPRGPATPVPVLPIWMLALLGLITGGVGMVSLRRS